MKTIVYVKAIVFLVLWRTLLSLVIGGLIAFGIELLGYKHAEIVFPLNVATVFITICVLEFFHFYNLAYAFKTRVINIYLASYFLEWPLKTIVRLGDRFEFEFEEAMLRNGGWR